MTCVLVSVWSERFEMTTSTGEMTLVTMYGPVRGVSNLSGSVSDRRALGKGLRRTYSPSLGVNDCVGLCV